ncbi:MAG: PEP-CTERM system histidine kinase PrsK [Alphaproteobacteria bacterium]|nr:PEP-CTERM system histidine kinase PrsK [Alphaproteobacteria bacterium]
MVVETVYSGCALAFALVIALMVLRGRTSRTGVAIIACCAASAVWATATAMSGSIPAAALAVLDSIRLSAWLIFAVALLTAGGGDAERKRAYLIGAAAYCGLAIAIDLRGFIPGLGAGDLFAQMLVRIGFGVLGLLTVENLWRNTDLWRRWHVWPLCLALGLLYAYELFLFSDAFITQGQVDPGLALGRAIAAAFVVPLLALAMARNREWRVDIHVSRQVVLHTATLLASGCFLLAVAAVAVLLRGFGGDWGLVLQLAMLIGSIVVLTTVLSSGSYRRRLKFLISRNFFTHRYDYRVEWLKFIELISDSAGGEELQVRIIRALAEFVDSPAGVLWSAGSETGYRPTAGWRTRADRATALAADAVFLAGFRDGGWIQQCPPEPADGHWSFASPQAWLAVPLSHCQQLVGFVVLDHPRHLVTLDWEAFDLLRAAGRQAASYLAEEGSTRRLRDTELLTEYSKRFAFVVHDIKNLASQLGLIITNAQRHIDNPEFRRDMLSTVEDAVSRMNHLLNQLRAEDASAVRLANPAAIASVVAREFSIATEIDDDSGCCNVTIAPDRLRSALTHLVQNALDASPAGDPVVLRAHCRGRRFLIDVVDRGVGMDEAFIRNELFLPFRSTKSGGYGIGAFQTRELIRTAGGNLEVISQPGVGTTMRIVLPLAESREVAPSTAA